MEANAALGCLSALLAFAAATLAGWLVLSRRCGAPLGMGTADRAGVSARARRAGSLDGWVAWRLRNGVAWARPAGRALMRSRRMRKLLEEGAWLLSEHGRPTDAEALSSCALAVACALALIVGMIARSVACAAAVTGCAAALAAAAVRAAQDRRREALREAVPDALRSMGVCFQAGFTLLQTFTQVAKETRGPLRDLFSRAAHVLETGGSAGEALALFRSGASVPELAFVAVALDVQHQAGGSLRQVLDAARETVEGELELKRSLRVQTAQAKLSARIVSVMPFVLIALFSLVSEGFLEPFFASAAGLALLAVAIGMQVAGVAAVRRLLAVEVGS